MRTDHLLADLVLSPLAGYVGTKAMEPVSMKLYELEPVADRAREDAARPGAPYQLAAEKIAAILGLELDDDQMSKASMASAGRRCIRSSGATPTGIPSSPAWPPERPCRSWPTSS